MLDPIVYAHLCAEAYDAKPDIQSGPVAKAIIRETADGRVLAAPGTANWQQVLADLDIGPIHIEGLGDVHEGTFNAMKSLAIRADAALGNNPGILIGHSLGGMLMGMLAAHRCLLGKPPKAVVVFGPAPIGLGASLRRIFEKYKVPCAIYRNGGDPVPLLLHGDDNAGWEHYAYLRPIGHPCLFPGVDDHMIAEYIQSLEGVKA